eukprot:UC4_evm1s458
MEPLTGPSNADDSDAYANDNDDGQQLLSYRRSAAQSANPFKEDDFDMEELPYILHNLAPHHTIEGIALQYRVKVEDIKRFNKLRSLSEIYTLKSVKIPQKKGSLLM